MRFREFLRENIEVNSLEEFASTVGNFSAYNRKICITYKGQPYCTTHGATHSGFDWHSRSIYYFARNHDMIVLYALRDKKAFLIVYGDSHGGPNKMVVLNDSDFVKAMFGDVLEKDRVIKILLKSYRDNIIDAQHSEFAYPRIYETPMFLLGLIDALKKTGHKWSELDDISKSVKAHSES